MKILIADDDERVRRSVIELLAFRPKCEVCGEARDGPEAIQKAAELLPDLVLLDISMPGIDGLAVARQLRSKFPAAAIVLMSQHDPDLLYPAGPCSRRRWLSRQNPPATRLAVNHRPHDH